MLAVCDLENENKKEALSPRLSAKADIQSQIADGGGAILYRGIFLGYTKLDETLLRSSIMAEDPTVFKVWIALLAACKPVEINGEDIGLADVSPVFLSSICHLDLNAVNNALLKLSSPDSESRSTEGEGRRIKKIDGGYKIINYWKYRDMPSQKSSAIRMRRLRRKRHIARHAASPNVTNRHTASASASSYVFKSKNKEEIKGGCNIVIPDWIPKDEFEEYRKMRIKIKKQMTGKAVELAVNKLEKLKKEGYDLKAVLEQSILNSWQGLFPVKIEGYPRGTRPIEDWAKDKQ